MLESKKNAVYLQELNQMITIDSYKNITESQEEDKDESALGGEDSHLLQ